MSEMTLEKLQMVATCSMTGAQKTKILKWWNSSAPSHEARKFPQKPVSENSLPVFLAKCVWYVTVRDLFSYVHVTGVGDDWHSYSDLEASNASMNLKNYIGYGCTVLCRLKIQPYSTST